MKENLSLTIAIFQLFAYFGILIFVLLVFYNLIHSNKKDHIGYVPTNLKKIGPVLEDLIGKYIGQNTEKYNLIEPGAGFANVADYLARKLNWKNVIAVEDEPGLFFFAKLKQRFLRKTKIEFVKSNVLDCKIPEKSVVYCYLLSEIITKMHEKALFKGQLVISLTFPINGIFPTETIEIAGFEKQILVYDFRAEK